MKTIRMTRRTLIGLLALPAVAHAQCPYAWATGFGSPGNGVDDGPLAWAVFDDDGPGPHQPALYAAGWFNNAGGATVNHIARWTGSGWAPLGTGISGAYISALAVYDDDGAGPHNPALYATGDFFTAGGVTAYRIARWDGAAWGPVAGGLLGGVPRTLVVFNDGSGEKLYAGGDFQTSSGNSVPKVAKWDGFSWTAVPNTFNSEVDVLYGYQGQLYAGGMFSSPGNNIARYDGVNWIPLGIGMDGHIVAMAAFDDDGPGPIPEALYVGGFFRHSGGVETNYIARWNGSSWSAVNGGVGGTNPPEAPFVRALAVFDDGGGPAMYVGGEFFNAGGIPANSIARWNGTTFAPLGAGIAGSLPWVFSFGTFDQGAGPSLWAGGVFDSAGASASSRVARWACTPCYPNCDASTIAPILNIQDFICFLNKFAAANPYANCDHSTTAPVLNIQDFTCFLNQFAVGCP